MNKENKRKEKLLSIYDHFGIKTQSIKIVEEAAELGTEIMQDNYLGIIEEIADIQVLLSQIKAHFDIEEEEIEYIMEEKIDRTLKRIKEGYYDNHR